MPAAPSSNGPTCSTWWWEKSTLGWRCPEPGLVGTSRGWWRLAAAAASVLETNIDDMAPNLLADLPQLMLDAGAVEAFITPVVMKKGRSGAPGHSDSATPARPRRWRSGWCGRPRRWGVRVREERRYVAGRRIERMQSSLGAVNVKLKIVDGDIIDATPEYEDVRALAAAAGILCLDAHRQLATEARSRFVQP